MSDSDEDNFQFYGTLLEPYEEDAVPKKKAFSIEDQIATDEHGRRRFHGAFTGGFSAGFFNTVGSLEGWKPSEFKSSRSEKAEKKVQIPKDFMDDEDVGEFGIAPSVVRATNDYSNKTSRKRTMNTEGPIPGVPVLQSLLQPARETIGIHLLKKMGWKPGQGVGPRLTKSEKRKRNYEHKQNSGKIYGCEIPEEYRQQIQQESESSSEDDTDITFAPDDYDPFIYKPKDNTFGMGYSGLDKRPILSSHISLFDPPEFRMRDHKNSKVSISGQAFGVGAFENEDEDIYARDDMTKYDFELESSSKKKKTPKKITEKPLEKILEGFTIGKNPISVKKSFPPPVLPKNFIPKHGARISRFEPLSENHKMYNYDRTRIRGRHDLSATERSKIINSEIVILNSDSAAKEVISTPFNIPQEKENNILKEKAIKITTDLPNTSIGSFKPFISHPDKQKRYEEYLTLLKLGQEKQLIDIQPASMTDWEKERERYEFSQAAQMFKPVTGLVFDRFVAASTPDSLDPAKSVEKSIYQHGTQDMRDAAKKKMFGQLTRNVEIWKPNKLLCKRFNVPEPEISETEMTLSKKKRNKFSVFDYYEAYQQNTVNKEGPQLINETQKDNKQSSEDIHKTVNKLPEPPNIETTLNTEKIPVTTDTKLVPTENKNTTAITDITKSSNEIIIPKTISLEKPIDINTKYYSNSMVRTEPISNPSTSKSNTTISKPIPLPTDPKEKKDLFKAIFLSSSESENEKSDNETEEKKEDKIIEMKKIILEDDTKINEQPNIRPSKGIFADLDWSKVNKNKTNNTTSVNNQDKEESKAKSPVIEEKEENTYGPKLPIQITSNKVKDEIQWKPTFHHVKPVKIEIDSSSSSADEWMEADIIPEKSKKTSKKHKKHKSKHKKHKSKHKKKHSSRH